MSRKLDFSSFADFLGAAIKDAGPNAELPKDKSTIPNPSTSKVEPSDTEAVTPNQETLTAPETLTALETKAKAGSKKKKKGKSQSKNSAQNVEEAQEVEPQDKDDVANDMRRLVSVKKIDSIESFDAFNNLVQIEGWKVRAPKSKHFKKDELVIFLEVDTFLPAGGEWDKAFAEVGTPTVFEGEQGYRVATHQYISFVSKKTIISQGHVYKLTQFPRVWADVHIREQDFSGTRAAFVKMIREVDYTAMLGPGVRKWTGEPSDAHIQAPQKFPQFIKKTNMDRVQNCPNLFTKPKYKTQIFQESIKMDGQSMTVYFVHKDSRYYSHLPPLKPNPLGYQYAQLNNGRLGVCSKNHDISYDPANVYWRAAIQADYATKLSQFGKTIAVQGELVGDKIAGNMHNYPPGLVEFWVYSIYEIHGSIRWDPREVEKWAAEQKLRHVIVTGYGTVHDFARKHDDFLLRADLSIDDEGLVYKNCTDGRWFKVLSRHYILEKERIIRGEEEEDDEDSIPGYVIDDDEADAWLDAYENGELEDNPDVQAFLAWWDEAWGGPARDKGKRKFPTKTQPQITCILQQENASATEKTNLTKKTHATDATDETEKADETDKTDETDEIEKVDQTDRTEMASSPAKQAEAELKVKKESMKDVIAWLAQGIGEAENWKGLGYL